MRNNRRKRLVVVSNRLPFSINDEHESMRIEPGWGGLVAALSPVLRECRGVWIGWAGTFEEVENRLLERMWSESVGYQVLPVGLSQTEHEKFYVGFSHQIIWPLFHDLQSHCNFFNNGYWEHYEGINQKYAQAILSALTESDYIWVHDYHLMNVAQELRSKGIDRPLGFFLHIPFPPPEIFLKLPWRLAVIEAMMEYDQLGFQTAHDRSNFVQCAQLLCKDVKFTGQGRIVTLNRGIGRTEVGYFPVGIYHEKFSQLAATEEVKGKVRQLRDSLAEQRIILGIDQLDHTNGLICKLEGFRYFLRHYPEFHKQVTLVQVVLPNREMISHYQELRREIDRLVSVINGEFSTADWLPVRYIYRNLEYNELLSFYNAAHIALITPLKDGMNLVAKEYCAANTDKQGVLILSEFAGAAEQLKAGALMVNPYNVEAVADALCQAMRMQTMERRKRMQRMQSIVRRRDVFWWMDEFLRAGVAADQPDTSSKQSVDTIAVDKEKKELPAAASAGGIHAKG